MAPARKLDVLLNVLRPSGLACNQALLEDTHSIDEFREGRPPRNQSHMYSSKVICLDVSLNFSNQIEVISFMDAIVDKD